MDGAYEPGFDEIYKRFYRKGFLFTKSYVHDVLIAEDITSDTLLRFWEQTRRETIRHPDAFLLTMLRNKILDWLKHEIVREDTFREMRNFYEEELSMRITMLEACDPKEIFTAEINEIVNKTLKQFPEQTRLIFHMSRMENKTNKEIAESLGLSVKSVEYHITKVLKLLRVTLKDYLPLVYYYFFLY